MLGVERACLASGALVVQYLESEKEGCSERGPRGQAMIALFINWW